MNEHNYDVLLKIDAIRKGRLQAMLTERQFSIYKEMAVSRKPGTSYSLEAALKSALMTRRGEAFKLNSDALLNKELEGVDPFDKNHPDEVKRKILEEARDNLVYFWAQTTDPKNE